ncbi:SH3 domain-containing kinase-binding protein 1 isoform X3 [Synchiropus splendidus]|uniref:SH3 domain-containing kinase-binding protein 1 isoform X3 n=1 Tax=Synchiropus splendidus TaxID=270530 RepID=UPI00237E297A|nr:SH3 domain-containing kinase-binding protein 1 isoform X3 [Synchiropus splendidus]
MVEAVVEFNYEAQQDDELSLTVGDIIVNIRRDDGGWWEGELGGRRGLFPDNFVREIKKEAKRDGGQTNMIKSDLANGRASPVLDSGMRPGKKAEQIRKRRCKAAFSYVPQHEDELELKIGDIIEIIAEVEEGWWEGLLNGKSGMFPSNFTKEIILDSDPPSVDSPSSQDDVCSGRSSKDSPGSESDGAESRSDGGSSEIQPKKVRGFGFGDIFKDKPIKLRPRSIDLDSEGDKFSEGKAVSVATETMKTDPDGKAKAGVTSSHFRSSGRELCKVLFPYEAQNEDELTIKEGEIITIITKECADAGWWMGEIGGRHGVFPDNFVKLLEAEKERPKKPPPPTAPSVKHTPDLDLDAVVSTTEKLSHPTALRPRVTDRRPRSQILTPSSMSILDLNPVAVEDRREKDRDLDSKSLDISLRKGVHGLESKAQIPSKPSVLAPPSNHRPASPSSSGGLSPSPELRHSPVTPPTLEELKNQLRDLRTSVELLRSQHRQEMKQLASELDEEKKIRISLQMEVEHIKKNLSK